MDMMFRDGECSIRTGHAQANFTMLRHMAKILYRKSPMKDSMRLKQKPAAWDDEYLVASSLCEIFTRFPWPRSIFSCLHPTNSALTAAPAVN